MTGMVKEMFGSRVAGSHSDFVFPAKNGKARLRISKSFERVINDFGFNESVANNNRKQKFTFYSCRHTCASWLAQAGASLFVIKEILRHANIDMTMRYSHLSPDGMKAAAEILEKSLIQNFENSGKQNLAIISQS